MQGVPKRTAVATLEFQGAKARLHVWRLILFEYFVTKSFYGAEFLFASLLSAGLAPENKNLIQTPS